MVKYSGLFELETQFPHVWAWYQRATARPATARGLAIPNPAASSNYSYPKRLAEEEGFKEKEEEVRKFLQEAKEKYGYKYASP
jgi:glutathione S-transferase